MESEASARPAASAKAPEGTFVVCIPAFNRADTIGRAIESVQAQTYPKWECLVLDDGSSDGTADVAETYSASDPRVRVLRFPTNRGGIAMNELGMGAAVERGEYWSRLGSDDWWFPEKLANDLKAFNGGARAVFGPYDNVENGVAGRPGNGRRSWREVKDSLLGGRFCVSWANVAARTDVLCEVRERFGRFGDGRLRHMEDFIFNWRTALLGVAWTWRPGCDGVWNVNRANGESYNTSVLDADTAAMAALVEEHG